MTNRVNVAKISTGSPVDLSATPQKPAGLSAKGYSVQTTSPPTCGFFDPVLKFFGLSGSKQAEFSKPKFNETPVAGPIPPRIRNIAPGKAETHDLRLPVSGSVHKVNPSLKQKVSVASTTTPRHYAPTKSPLLSISAKGITETIIDSSATSSSDTQKVNKKLNRILQAENREDIMAACSIEKQDRALAVAEAFRLEWLQGNPKAANFIEKACDLIREEREEAPLLFLENILKSSTPTVNNLNETKKLNALSERVTQLRNHFDENRNFWSKKITDIRQLLRNLKNGDLNAESHLKYGLLKRGNESEFNHLVMYHILDEADDNPSCKLYPRNAQDVEDFTKILLHRNPNLGIDLCFRNNPQALAAAHEGLKDKLTNADASPSAFGLKFLHAVRDSGNDEAKKFKDFLKMTEGKIPYLSFIDPSAAPPAKRLINYMLNGPAEDEKAVLKEFRAAYNANPALKQWWEGLNILNVFGHEILDKAEKSSDLKWLKQFMSDDFGALHSYVMPNPKNATKKDWLEITEKVCNNLKYLDESSLNRFFRSGWSIHPEKSASKETFLGNTNKLLEGLDRNNPSHNRAIYHAIQEFLKDPEVSRELITVLAHALPREQRAHAYQTLDNRFFATERLASSPEARMLLAQCLKNIRPELKEPLKEKYLSELGNSNKADSLINILLHQQISGPDELEGKLKALNLDQNELVKYLRTAARGMINLDMNQDLLSPGDARFNIFPDISETNLLVKLMLKDPDPAAYFAPKIGEQEPPIYDTFSQLEAIAHVDPHLAKKLVAVAKGEEKTSQQSAEQPIAEIKHFFSELNKNYPQPGLPEDNTKREKLCADTLKTHLFKLDQVDFLETFLAEVTHQENHPLKEILQKALNKTSSPNGFERRFNVARTAPAPLFAEAFNNPSVLTQWQNIIDGNAATSQQLKEQLTEASRATLSPTLKRFLDLSLSKHDNLNTEAQHKELTESLKHFTPYDWKQLQSLLPGDDELLNRLYGAKDTKSPGINRLALNLLYRLPQSGGEGPLLYQLIGTTPGFKKLAEPLLHDYLRLAETRQKEKIEQTEKTTQTEKTARTEEIKQTASAQRTSSVVKTTLQANRKLGALCAYAANHPKALLAVGGLLSIVATLAPLISILVKSKQMEAFSAASIDEAESTDPIEETKPDKALPTSEEDMSPRAKELMYEAQALFETELREDELSPDMNDNDRKFFGLGSDGIEISDAAYAYFEMQATIEGLEETAPQLKGAYEKLPTELIEAKTQELIEEFKANPDQLPLNQIFAIENGEVTPLTGKSAAYIEAAARLDLLEHQLSLRDEVEEEPYVNSNASEPEERTTSPLNRLASDIQNIAVGSTAGIGAMAGAIGLGGLAAAMLGRRGQRTKNATASNAPKAVDNQPTLAGARPAQGTPIQATPAGARPAQGVPTQATPAGARPAQDASTQATPAGTGSAQDASTRATSSGARSTQDASTQTTPAGTGSAQDAATRATSSEARSTQDASTQTIPAGTGSAQDASAQATRAGARSTQDASTQTAAPGAKPA